MPPTQHIATLAGLVLVLSTGVPLPAADVPIAPETPVADATQKRSEIKAARIVEALRLEDAAEAGRVKAVVARWLVTMWRWHEDHDPHLKELWSQWSEARAVVPKDEFPGEVIAHQIDRVYDSLRPAYRAFLDELARELSAEQIDAVKENWSRSPGMQRTYESYLAIVPDLDDEQRKVIHDRMYLAREDAMLTDADREIVNIFKRHKVKVEAYIGGLEWARLHRAFANRGKTTTPGAGQN